MTDGNDEEGSYGGSGDGSVPANAAADAANDKIYEPKNKKTLIRVLTVVAYVFFVSLAAIMLSAYYIFMWDPYKLAVGKNERLQSLNDLLGH